ncbi:MAG: ATP synthase F1 subunit epsilon [Gemmatimonadetes bacterium RBG_16_66_8]|nr:MAG: ATP synthase F1 subunit epsilon [Gemmatimonadetes bacterium RBG_16_66_8]
MHVTIISPERAVYDGDGTSVVAPAYDGEVGILPRHAPFTTLLGSGRLIVRRGAEATEFRVVGGFLQVRNDAVRIVAEQISEGASNAS